MIEAAPEKLDFKRDIFKQLDAICAPATLLASNTSSFNVTAIAASTQHQERVLGLHFFNPPPLMALVEVIQGDRTSAATIEKATQLMRAMGKTPRAPRTRPGSSSIASPGPSITKACVFSATAMHRSKPSTGS